MGSGIITVTNSLDPDETPSYSASHLDPNCLQGKHSNQTGVVNNASEEEKKLDSVKCIILEELEPLCVVDYIFHKGGLTNSQHREIKSVKIREERCRNFYIYLLRNLPTSFSVFMSALNETGNRYILKKLEKPWYEPERPPRSVPTIVSTCTDGGSTHAGSISTIAVEITAVTGMTCYEYLEQMSGVLGNVKKRCKVANQTFSMYQYLITDFNKSPFVIILKPCKTFNQTVQQSLDEVVRRIVQEILRRCKNTTDIQNDKVCVEYKLRYDFDTERACRTAINVLIWNMEQLQEEMQPTDILREFQGFTEKERQKIINKGRRREMVATMVKIVIIKGEAFAIQFIWKLFEIDSFREHAKVMFRQCKFDQPHALLAKNYSRLVEEISPDKLAPKAVQRHLISDKVMSELRMILQGYRSLKAMLLIHAILSSGTIEAKGFCELLKSEGYELQDDQAACTISLERNTDTNVHAQGSVSTESNDDGNIAPSENNHHVESAVNTGNNHNIESIIPTCTENSLNVGSTVSAENHYTDECIAPTESTASPSNSTPTDNYPVVENIQTVLSPESIRSNGSDDSGYLVVAACHER